MRRKREPKSVGVEVIAEALRHLAQPIDSLVLDPKNARKHGPENLRSIERSLKKFGQRIPIVVQREGMVVRAGNGRVMAARKLGWTQIAAVVVEEKDAEAVAFAIVDNRTAELATWDTSVLSEQLAFIQQDNAELLAHVGFESKDQRVLLGMGEDAPKDVFGRRA